jgi:hypothetical protein
VERAEGLLTPADVLAYLGATVGPVHPPTRLIHLDPHRADSPWTRRGVLRVRFLSEMLGRRVTAAERDAGGVGDAGRLSPEVRRRIWAYWF